VVDDDLGVSGSGKQERHGFARLLTAVCAGEVGAVFALEASRLARNNRDWHNLIDLCALNGGSQMSRNQLIQDRAAKVGFRASFPREKRPA